MSLKETILEKINQPYNKNQQLKAYNTLKSYYPDSALKYISMNYWFKIINESMRMNHMTSGQNALFEIYKKEIENDPQPNK